MTADEYHSAFDNTPQGDHNALVVKLGNRTLADVDRELKDIESTIAALEEQRRQILAAAEPIIKLYSWNFKQSFCGGDCV